LGEGLRQSLEDHGLGRLNLNAADHSPGSGSGQELSGFETNPHFAAGGPEIIEHRGKGNPVHKDIALKSPEWRFSIRGALRLIAAKKNALRTRTTRDRLGVLDPWSGSLNRIVNRGFRSIVAPSRRVQDDLARSLSFPDDCPGVIVRVLSGVHKSG
jgi:hypothetical protein